MSFRKGEQSQNPARWSVSASEDDGDETDDFVEGKDETTAFLKRAASPHAEAPPDHCFSGYLLFVLLGVGVLFPWNAFLTALDYFLNLYTDFPFLFAVSLAFNYPSVFFLLLNIKFGPRFSFTLRMLLGFGVVIAVQIITPFIDTFGLSTAAAMWITLVGVFLTGCASSMLFGTVLGMAALFPPQFTGGIMVGNGIAGVLAGGLRIITKAAMPEGSQASIIVYFAISACLMMICIFGYFALLRLPLTKYYLLQQKASTTEKPTENINSSSCIDDVEASNPEGQKPISISYLGLLWRLKREAIVVLSVFFVTLSLFPSMTAEIDTTTSLSQGWFSVFLVFTFQVFDFVGRSIPRFLIVFNEKTLWIPALLRVGFFPLFILCINPLVFTNDGWYYSFMVLFAVSNGYCGTLAMMFGPVNALEHEKEVAGIVMSFFLNFGIFLATHFALLLNFLVTGSTPW